jgi:hypothetical protein
MHIPRFRIRSLMIAVALAGLLLATARVVYFRRHYQMVAMMHRNKENAYVRQALQAEKRRDWAALQAKITQALFILSQNDSSSRTATQCAALASDMRQRAAWESQLAQKYENAARRPWLFVPPDPLMP